MNKLIATIVFGLFLCGCAYTMKTPFDPVHHKRFVVTARGTAGVKGQAFAVQRGGGVVYAAGCEIELYPNTPYFQEMNSAIRRGRRIDNYAPEAREYIRETVADAEGRFEFKNVPAGYYCLLTNITWEVPNGTAFMTQEGGAVFVDVNLKSDEVADVIMKM
jgi:hypothetical protein